jgi:hypothetical protein
MIRSIFIVLILMHVIIILVMPTEPYKIDHEIGARIKRESDSSKNSTGGDGGFALPLLNGHCPVNHTMTARGRCVPICSDETG